MEISLGGWLLFNAFVLLMLAVDLFVFNRKNHVVTLRESLTWTAVWVAVSLVFFAGLWWQAGREPALEYLTGYLVEKSLSADNIFVFLLIFRYFAVPNRYQHRILFWGVVGALVMRFVFIFAGVALISQFHGILYVFGAFLLYSGIKMARNKDQEVHPDQNPVVRLFKRVMPVTEGDGEGKLFTRENGRLVATRLFIVLLVIETSDLLFAVDSIPAILAITQDTFLVYSSNVFAILGLRALYFALADVMERFHHLHYGLSGILIFIGIKMLLIDLWHVPVELSLAVIVALLAGSIITSLKFPPRDTDEPPLPPRVSEGGQSGDGH